METYAIEFYLYCKWADIPPVYRLYYNDELMTERTYIWNNDTHVLKERVPVIIDGAANIKIEQIGQHTGKFSVKQTVDWNLRRYGPALNFEIV